MLRHSVSGKTGFTFEEMLVVLAVLGVLASILINSMVRVDDEAKYRKKTNISQHIADKRNYANRMRGIVDTISIRLTDKDGNLVAPFNGLSAGDKIALTISQREKWKCRTISPSHIYATRIYEYRQVASTSPLAYKYYYNFSVIRYPASSGGNPVSYVINRTVSGDTQKEALLKLQGVLEENERYFPDPQLTGTTIANLAQNWTSVKNMGFHTEKVFTNPNECFYNLDANCSMDGCSTVPDIVACEDPDDGTSESEYKNTSHTNPPAGADGFINTVYKSYPRSICEKEATPTDLVTAEITLPNTSEKNKFINIKTYNKVWNKQVIDRKEAAGTALSDEEKALRTK